MGVNPMIACEVMSVLHRCLRPARLVGIENRRQWCTLRDGLRALEVNVRVEAVDHPAASRAHESKPPRSTSPSRVHSGEARSVSH